MGCHVVVSVCPCRCWYSPNLTSLSHGYCTDVLFSLVLSYFALLGASRVPLAQYADGHQICLVDRCRHVACLFVVDVGLFCDGGGDRNIPR